MRTARLSAQLLQIQRVRVLLRHIDAHCEGAESSQHNQQKERCDQSEAAFATNLQIAGARSTKRDESIGEPRIGTHPGEGTAASAFGMKSYVCRRPHAAAAKSVIAVTCARRRKRVYISCRSAGVDSSLQ